MILLPRSVRVYVAAAPANLRKSFEGLTNEVRSLLALDPLSGHVFVFLNRRRTQVKMLLFTRGGFTIVHKRLERGRFSFPDQLRPGATAVEVDAHELSMLLEGLAAPRGGGPPARGGGGSTRRSIGKDQAAQAARAAPQALAGAAPGRQPDRGARERAPLSSLRRPSQVH